MGWTRQRRLVATEKCVISRVPWGSLSRLPPKRAHAGVPAVRGLAVSPWPPGHPHGPAPSPEGAPGLLREPRVGRCGSWSPSEWCVCGAPPAGRLGACGWGRAVLQMEKSAAAGSASGGQRAMGGGGRERLFWTSVPQSPPCPSPSRLPGTWDSSHLCFCSIAVNSHCSMEKDKLFSV